MTPLYLLAGFAAAWILFALVLALASWRAAR